MNETCVLAKTKCSDCKFCQWIAGGSNLDECQDAIIYAPEACRIIRVFEPPPKREDETPKSFLIQTGQMRKKIRICKDAHPTNSTGLTICEKRLFKFLRLLNYMGTAPWANVSFSTNTTILHRLTASHLHLIVGKTEFRSAPKTKLYATICADLDLQSAQNLIWITNR